MARRNRAEAVVADDAKKASAINMCVFAPSRKSFCDPSLAHVGWVHDSP